MTIHINELPPFWPDTLGVDLETTSLDLFTGNILSIALSDGHDTWIVLHWWGLDKLRDVLEDESIVKIMHNAQFDLSFIKYKLGIETQNIYDSMLAEQVLVAARDMQVSLADTLARRLGVMVYKEVRSSFFDHPGFHLKPPTEEQLQYMAEDVIHLPALMKAQLEEAEKEKCVWPIQIENAAVPAFAEIRIGGFKLDVDLWYEYLKVFQEKVVESENKLRSLLGEDFVLSFTTKSVKNPKEKNIPVNEINFGSPDQLKRILTGHFKLSIESTNEKILQELNATLDEETPAYLFIQELLICRHFKKCISWDYPKFVHPVTGKVHPDFRQNGTDTSRVAVSKPNLQQIPRPEPGTPNFRQLWLADDEDMVLCSQDYSQQEPRVLAQVSNDPAMIAACSGIDVYSEIGSFMFDKPVKKGDPERQDAKTFVLAVGYRSGIKKLHRQSGLSLKRCEEIRDIIWNKFPTMKRYGQMCENFATRNGYIMAVTGRRRYFNEKSVIYTEAINSVVQTTSAEMTKIALAEIYQTLVKWKKEGQIDKRTRVWHLMHDEIVLVAQKDEADKVIAMAKECMGRAGVVLCPAVTHVAEAHYGFRWDK